MKISIRDILFPPPLLIGLVAIAILTDVPRMILGIAEAPRSATISVETPRSPGTIHSTNIHLVDDVTLTETIMEIAERSALSETRERWVAPVAEAPATTATPDPVPVPPEPEPVEVEKLGEPPLVFLGRLNDGGEHRALLRNTRTGRDTWFGLGDVFEGWTVVEIRPDGVLFQADTQDFLAILDR